MLFAGGLLAGALVGGLLARLQFARREESGTESIFVGNLAFRMPPDALRELFEQYGKVHAVRLMTDRVTRKPRGFGFVVMNKRDARAAIKALNGKEFFGRQLKV
ncbi:MAG TPA: RNA-binding protein, partial [Gammaproteobacteria bacterium]|nr:RNA-binding protein [Gammaproteobacteria bacterium]